MGRKKPKVKPLKPWCYYCRRVFDNEKVLYDHQKAKHFKCTVCHKKLSSAHGLVIHITQVHKESIIEVPGADSDRKALDVDIHGMTNIPEAAIEEMKIQQQGGGKNDDDEPAAKKQKVGGGQKADDDDDDEQPANPFSSSSASVGGGVSAVPVAVIPPGVGRGMPVMPPYGMMPPTMMPGAGRGYGFPPVAMPPHIMGGMMPPYRPGMPMPPMGYPGMHAHNPMQQQQQHMQQPSAAYSGVPALPFGVTQPYGALAPHPGVFPAAITPALSIATAGSAAAESEGMEGGNKIVFVYKDQADECMEEKRARLGKHAVKTQVGEDSVSKMSASIADRLKSLQQAH